MRSELHMHSFGKFESEPFRHLTFIFASVFFPHYLNEFHARFPAPLCALNKNEKYSRSLTEHLLIGVKPSHRLLERPPAHTDSRVPSPAVSLSIVLLAKAWGQNTYEARVTVNETEEPPRRAISESAGLCL